MSPSGAVHVPVSVGFPRVSGDEPEAFQVNGAPPLFSPRERG